MCKFRDLKHLISLKSLKTYKFRDLNHFISLKPNIFVSLQRFKANVICKSLEGNVK